jgi:hypothetical protein
MNFKDILVFVILLFAFGTPKRAVAKGAYKT